MFTWLAIGVGLGVLLTIPVAAFYSRRATQRVRDLEQRARSAQRLAEIGTMTGGLAHEIKNPLSSINLNMQLLQEDLDKVAKAFPKGSAQREELSRTMRRFDALARESQRIKHILEDFLRFAGRMELDRADVNVNELVEDLADFFDPQAAAAGVRVRTQLVASPGNVDADAGLLKQALLNLMINAVRAMQQARERAAKGHDVPHGGANELMLRTENARVGGVRAVAIHVIDTGPGIKVEDRQRIFQPYVSNAKGGTGLGLPTAQRICEEHGGTLQLHSEGGRGSDFTITLPRESVAATAPSASSP